MMFARAASRALRHRNGYTDEWSPSVTIGDLPEEVLLEIFNCYGQTFQDDSHERIWNSNKGWFKLAHVCREWRWIVLASPSRLRVRLLMTTKRTPRAIALKSLPPLPIIIDYRDKHWTTKIRNRMIFALAHPDRVCGIAITIPRTGMQGRSKLSKKLLAAMNQPFPALESLELFCPSIHESIVSPPFLTSPTPHLRRLEFTFFSKTPTFLSNLLSRTTSLVDLTLRLYSLVFSSLETQLLAHIQDMSSLGRLELEMRGVIFPEAPLRNMDVLLPNLTFLRITGRVTQLEALFACLAAPSLRELHITPYHFSFEPESPTTHLPRFIRNVGKPFFSAQLNSSRVGINLFMSTYSQSTDDPPFIFIVNPMPQIYLMNDVFSETLANVQVVFVVPPFGTVVPVPRVRGHFPWLSFFKLFRNAKTLRVSHGMVQEVGNILRPDNEGSSLQLLPALEQIALDATMRPDTPNRIDEGQLGPIFSSFKLFMDERQQAGHPVTFCLNPDWVRPKHFRDVLM